MCERRERCDKTFLRLQGEKMRGKHGRIGVNVAIFALVE
jgi:hypothetical protein